MNTVIANAFQETTEPGEVLLDYAICARFETADGEEYAQYISNKSLSSSTMIGLLETVKHMALSGIGDIPNNEIEDLTDLLDDPDEPDED